MMPRKRLRSRGSASAGTPDSRAAATATSEPISQGSGALREGELPGVERPLQRVARHLRAGQRHGEDVALPLELHVHAMDILHALDFDPLALDQDIIDEAAKHLGTGKARTWNDLVKAVFKASGVKAVGSSAKPGVAASLASTSAFRKRSTSSCRTESVAVFTNGWQCIASAVIKVPGGSASFLSSGWSAGINTRTPSASAWTATRLA